MVTLSEAGCRLSYVHDYEELSDTPSEILPLTNSTLTAIVYHAYILIS